MRLISTEIEMGVEIHNWPDFEAEAEQLRRATETAFAKQVNVEMGEIILRTKRGESATGGRFKDYSPKYKAAKGRFVNGLANKWLELTGSMLGSLRNKSERIGGLFIGTIYTNDESRKSIRLPGIGKRKSKKSLKPLKAVSAADKIRGNDAIRPFFRLSELQIERLRKVIIDAIRNV